MRFDGPVLLYGAGREAKSTRAYLRQTAPDIPVFVTADTGVPELAGTEYIAPAALPEALHAGKFALIVKSPGVSRYKPIFETARTAGVPVTSNLNIWGADFRKDCKVIVITGTKGKSTTATLAWLMLKNAGIDAGLAGNVGVAPLDIGNRHNIVVLELSSYQTADMDFEPDFIGITSLYPEHVDWHGSVERYYADKLRIVARGGRFRLALSPQAHDARPMRDRLHHTIRRIMVLDPLTSDAVNAAIAKSRLRGAHNRENARLAARLAIVGGADLDGVLAGIAAFEPLPHRLQEHRFGDLLFVDDSISTTPQATEAALAAYPDRRIALIAGGHDRRQDYADLVRHLAGGSVTTLVCLPVTGTRLAEAVREQHLPIDLHETATLADGMALLSENTANFDTVLLSPGAASYNQFANFEERGAAFVTLAQRYFGASA